MSLSKAPEELAVTPPSVGECVRERLIVWRLIEYCKAAVRGHWLEKRGINAVHLPFSVGCVRFIGVRLLSLLFQPAAIGSFVFVSRSVGGREDEEECLFIKQTPKERHGGGGG